MKNNLYSFGLNLLEEYSPQWKLSEDYEAVTAANSDVFPGLLALFYSLKNKVSFMCYDIGLSDNHKEICKDIGLQVSPLYLPPILKTIKHWHWYVKPWVIEQSTKDYTIWFDTDCLAAGDPTMANLIKNKLTFFVKSAVRPEFLKPNKDGLYKKYPVANQSVPFINSGIFGVNKKDIKPFIIDKWMNIILKSILEGFNDLLVYQDEGPLNWALQEEDRVDLITNDYTYNQISFYCWSPLDLKIFIDPVLISKCPCSSIFFRRALCAAKEKNLFGLHFATGCNNMNRKYWHHWTTNTMSKFYQNYKSSTNLS